jgi:protein SCO1
MKPHRVSLVCALVAAGLLACSKSEPPRPPADPRSPASAPAEPPSPTAISGESIYVLKPALVDQAGATIPLDLFRGHPVLIAMFYGTCPAACPTLTRDIKNVLEAVDPARRADVRVLMVSFDAERDTPAALAALTAKHKVDPKVWRFAAANESSARELSAVLGVQYRKIEKGEFSHSTKIVLLDRGGVAVAELEGLGQPADALVGKLKATLGP